MMDIDEQLNMPINKFKVTVQCCGNCPKWKEASGNLGICNNQELRYVWARSICADFDGNHTLETNVCMHEDWSKE